MMGVENSSQKRMPLLKGNIRRWRTWSQDCDNRKMNIFNNSFNKYKMRDSSSIYLAPGNVPRGIKAHIPSVLKKRFLDSVLETPLL